MADTILFTEVFTKFCDEQLDARPLEVETATLLHRRNGTAQTSKISRDRRPRHPRKTQHYMGNVIGHATAVAVSRNGGTDPAESRGEEGIAA